MAECEQTSDGYQSPQPVGVTSQVVLHGAAPEYQ